jgi:group I intron endonuclease
MTWKSPYSRPGVYRITCLRNLKMYVGGTSNLYMRRANHLNRLKNGGHARRLQADWDRYGREAFEIDVIQYVDDVDDLHECEQFWIEALQTTDPRHGYNTVAAFVMPLPKRARSGWTMSEEQKAKIAAARRGQPISAEHKAALQAGSVRACAGRPLSDEHKAKIAASNRGRTLTPEQREKVAASKRGRTHSPEHRAAIAAGLRRRRETVAP